jgi:hypothetical protein
VLLLHVAEYHGEMKRMMPSTTLHQFCQRVHGRVKVTFLTLTFIIRLLTFFKERLNYS